MYTLEILTFLLYACKIRRPRGSSSCDLSDITGPIMTQDMPQAGIEKIHSARARAIAAYDKPRP